MTIVSVDDLEADDEGDEDDYRGSLMDDYSSLGERGMGEEDDNRRISRLREVIGSRGTRDRSRSQDSFGRRRRIAVTSHKDDMVTSAKSRSTRDSQGSGELTECIHLYLK